MHPDCNYFLLLVCRRGDNMYRTTFSDAAAEAFPIEAVRARGWVGRAGNAAWETVGHGMGGHVHGHASQLVPRPC